MYTLYCVFQAKVSGGTVGSFETQKVGLAAVLEKRSRGL